MPDLRCSSRCWPTRVGIAILVAFGAAVAAAEAGQPPADSLASMLARAEAAELDTEYVAPPGDPLSHHIAGFAKTLCSAVFVTGLDADFAAESVGFFSGPYEHRRRVTAREVDRDRRRVHSDPPRWRRADGDVQR